MDRPDRTGEGRTDSLGEAATDSTPAVNGAVLLVVDDSEMNVMLMRSLLASAGAARVEGVTDPRRAVEIYCRLQPDLVLLDLHMPDMDGLAVLRALKAVTSLNEFVPVIMLTGDATAGAKTRALALGANDILTKPFDVTEVLLRVNNHLEIRALQQTLRRHNQDLEEEIRGRKASEQRSVERRAERERQLRRVLDSHRINIVFQPIIDLRSNRIEGFEALARFSGEPPRPPNEWFADAAELGLGEELELLAVQSAIAKLHQVPNDTYLSVNVAPRTAVDSYLAAAISPVAERIVVELTEHTAVSEYDVLLTAVQTLRELGARIAIDDAGSGYASLQHILLLRPDIIKLDIGLTRGIHSDPARRALGVALVQFGRDIGADITAEGIEETGELDTLKHLGASAGQGFLLGRPGPLPTR